MPATPAATPLVLVPGLLCDARLWQPQMDGLAGHARCWVGDHTRSSSMAQVAADVLAQAPFPRFALAGLSMGGYVAMEMWRQAPERIDRIALLGTSARADTAEQTERRERLIDLARRGRFIGVGGMLLPMLIHPDRLTDRALVGVIQEMTQAIGSEAFIRQQHAIMSRIDSRPLLSQIRCPALVLCGREDELTPLALHVEMSAAIPGADLEVLEQCGHLSTLERPDAVTRALLRWLGAGR